jgi:hypothetical protein
MHSSRMEIIRERKTSSEDQLIVRTISDEFIDSSKFGYYYYYWVRMPTIVNASNSQLVIIKLFLYFVVEML